MEHMFTIGYGSVIQKWNHEFAGKKKDRTRKYKV